MIECALTVAPGRSGEAIATAADGRALVAACAEGAGFSSIELLQAALGTCLVASIAPVLARHGADATALRVAIAMPDASLDRGLTIDITLPPCDAALHTRCTRAVANCPVLRALNIPVDIHWQMN